MVSFLTGCFPEGEIVDANPVKTQSFYISSNFTAEHTENAEAPEKSKQRLKQS